MALGGVFCGTRSRAQPSDSAPSRPPDSSCISGILRLGWSSGAQGSVRLHADSHSPATRPCPALQARALSLRPRLRPGGGVTILFGI